MARNAELMTSATDNSFGVNFGDNPQMMRVEGHVLPKPECVFTVSSGLALTHRNEDFSWTRTSWLANRCRKRSQNRSCSQSSRSDASTSASSGL